MGTVLDGRGREQLRLTEVLETDQGAQLWPFFIEKQLDMGGVPAGRRGAAFSGAKWQNHCRPSLGPLY